MNLFSDLIQEGKIKSQKELTQVFRKLSKKLHPDTAKSPIEGKEFIALKKDYEASQNFLKHSYYLKQSQSTNNFDRKRYYRILSEIIHCNFPQDASVKNLNPLLRKRLHQLSQLHYSHEPRFHFSIEEFENELYIIRGEDIIDNPLFGQIVLIFVNLSVFHSLNSQFSLRSCNKWLKEILPELDNFPAVKETLVFWILDMDNGAAL